jgi:hypothetical protein
MIANDLKGLLNQLHVNSINHVFWDAGWAMLRSETKNQYYNHQEFVQAIFRKNQSLSHASITQMREDIRNRRACRIALKAITK